MSRAGDWETVLIEIHGIPALAWITHYEPGDRGSWWEPPQPEEVEWEACDRKGYPAAWLERLLDYDESRRVYAQVIAGVHAKQRKARDDAAMSKAKQRGII